MDPRACFGDALARAAAFGSEFPVGSRGEMSRSQQVVIRGMTGGENGPGATVKWALQRESGDA